MHIELCEHECPENVQAVIYFKPFKIQIKIGDHLQYEIKNNENAKIPEKSFIHVKTPFNIFSAFRIIKLMPVYACSYINILLLTHYCQ